MKEHFYKYNQKRVILKSALIWFVVLVQVALNLFILYNYNDNSIDALIAGNIAFTPLSFFGLKLHYNYLKHSKDSELIIRYNSITYKCGNKETTISSPEIIKVILHDGPMRSRLPWSQYHWFELIDEQNRSIKISPYLISISEFWTDSLTRRVSSNKLIRVKSIIPLIK